MKKALSLLLALVLCLSLCACGNGEEFYYGESDGYSESDAYGENDSSPTILETTLENDTTATDNIDFAEVLLNNGNFWNNINNDRGMYFHEDGRTGDSDVTWALDGDTVKITQENGDVDTYKFAELNGEFYLMGERNTMYSGQVEYNEIPCKSVEITLDNWQDYFELHRESKETFDIFGESTGTQVYYELRLKDEYSRIYLYAKSEVAMRYTQGGGEPTDNGIGYIWTHITIYDDLAVHPLEMVKIQGTLYLVDGL